jgi:hypothetical protein
VTPCSRRPGHAVFQRFLEIDVACLVMRGIGVGNIRSDQLLTLHKQVQGIALDLKMFADSVVHGFAHKAKWMDCDTGIAATVPGEKSIDWLDVFANNRAVTASLGRVPASFAGTPPPHSEAPKLR